MSTQKVSTLDALSLRPKVYVRVLRDNECPVTYEVGGEFSIGRASSNHVCLDKDPYVSMRHCVIERRGQQYVLRDLQSSNGTFLNGQSVLKVMLKDQDRIAVGRSWLDFCFSFREDEVTSFPLETLNPVWAEHLKTLPVMATSNLPVLITGPSGVGKDVLARSVHNLSPRHMGPFVSLNCGALSEQLVESELFGHLEGSFTGAQQARQGVFRAASGGTLFLDEIGDLPLPLQAKLLRSIENQEVKPVGADVAVPVDVRIVAATHKILSLQVKKKEFRQDLYFRLNVLHLRVPSLKQRMEDFDTFLDTFSQQYGVSFASDEIDCLKHHSWPGNIRELKNFVARAATLSKGSSQTCKIGRVRIKQWLDKMDKVHETE